MRRSTQMIVDDLFVRYPQLRPCKTSVEQTVDVISSCYRNRGKMLVCGNGGSSADALHIVGELMKSFLLPRTIPGDIKKCFCTSCSNGEYLGRHLQGALPAISLVNEVAFQTAYANDAAADLSFAQQVYGLGSPGDVLFAISTSGMSQNIIYAGEVAKVKDMAVIALTGASGGKLKDIADVLIAVPEAVTFQVQELHLPIYHAVCLALENEFFGNNETDKEC